MLTKLNLNNYVLKFCLAYVLVKIFVKYEKLLFVTSDFIRRNGLNYIRNKFGISGLLLKMFSAGF